MEKENNAMLARISYLSLRRLQISKLNNFQGK